MNGPTSALADAAATSRDGELRQAIRWTRVIVAIVLGGIGLRLAQYLWNQSYWNDEASLVLNIFSKSASELLGPLDHAQASPPVFLLALRGMHVALGRSEFVMRLLPLVLGILALITFARLASLLLPPAIAALSVALFALSDHLITHAAEAKQYSGDVFIAAILLLIALSGRERVAPDQRLFRVGITSAFTCWFSHPTAFMFGGIAIALLPGALGKTARRLPRVLLGLLAPTLSFVVLYAVSIRHQQNPMLFEYWADRFVDWSQPLWTPVWAVRSTIGLFTYSYDLGGPFLVPIAIFGAIDLWRTKRREVLGVLVLPIVLTMLAAGLHRYPFGGTRLTVFLAPGCLLLAGFGFEVAARVLSVRVRRWWKLFVALLLGLGMGVDAYHLIIPRYRGNMRPVVESIRQLRAPDEHVYVARHREFLCYWPNPDPLVHLGPFPDQFAPHRFWIAISFGAKGDLESELPSGIRALPPPQTTLRFRGGAALRYQRDLPQN